MRPAVVLIVAVLLIHVLRAPDVIIPPPLAQDIWPDPPQVQLPPVDLTLVEAAEMAGWKSTPVVVTAEEVRTDVHLWRRMFFYNWDLIASPLRKEGLLALHRRYRHLLYGPGIWEHMDADDWDRVPQAMRGMAVMAMIDCWVERYRPGERYGLSPREVGDRLKAVAMLESFFQHRAVNENADGGRDLGIAQASEYMRSRLRVLYVRGRSDFGLAENDYSDPWKATRALVFWFSLLLDEVGGDLDRATSAYHVGSARSQTRRGKAYRNDVARLEAEYVHGPSPSPTWDWLLARSPSPCPCPGGPDPPPPPPSANEPAGEDPSGAAEDAAISSPGHARR